MFWEKGLDPILGIPETWKEEIWARDECEIYQLTTWLYWKLSSPVLRKGSRPYPGHSWNMEKRDTSHSDECEIYQLTTWLNWKLSSPVLRKRSRPYPGHSWNIRKEEIWGTLMNVKSICWAPLTFHICSAEMISKPGWLQMALTLHI